MHQGTGLPVATMGLVLGEFASRYSSVATVKGAYSLQLMEAFGMQSAAALVGGAEATAAAGHAQEGHPHAQA